MTNTDLARADESSLDLLPPAQPVSSKALAVLHEHSQAMDIAYKYAQAVCGTQVCPVRFRGKPDDGAAAILYGLEIGLSPSAALQKVIVIHGMPSLEARTMVGLLKPRGYRVRTLEQTDEKVTVEGVDPEGERYVSQWTIERARQAGYVPELDEKTKRYKTNANGKLIGNEKYLTDPQAMLKAKAQSEVCRDMAPDVLLGISYTSEELQSERWDEPRPERPASRQSNPVASVDEIFNEQPAAAPVDVEVEDDDSSGAEQESEAEPAPESAPVEGPEPEPVTEAEAPKPDKPKSARRKAAEVRVTTLIGDITPDVTTDEEIIIYRSIAGRENVTSLDDLTDADLKAIGNRLYDWSKAGELNDQIRDLINAADLAAASAEQNAQQ